MNLKIVHYVQLALSLIAVCAQWAATAVPQYAVPAHALATLSVSLLGTLGLLSGSAAQPPPVDLGPLAPAPETSVAQTVATETKSLVAELQKEAGK